MSTCLKSDSNPSLPPSLLQLHRLTWWNRHSKQTRIDFPDPWSTTQTPHPDPTTTVDPHPDPASARVEDQERGRWWRRLALWMCGLSGPARPELSPEERRVLEEKVSSIQERRLWRNVLNAQALLLLSVNVFLWGYFA